MQDLRSEIRAAFDREQTADPAPANMRQRIALAATTPLHRNTLPQWMTVVAALLIGALVVSGLLYSRLGRNVSQVGPRSVASPVASPSVAPLPTEDYGLPPAGVPLFYLKDSKNPSWFIGYDWSGTPRGTIKLGQDPGGLYEAPDGSGFGYSVSGKGIGIAQWLDRLGRPISDPDQTNYQSVMWAADSRQICTLDGTGGQWHLGLKTPGSPPVTQVVTIPGSNSWGGIIALAIAACSPATGRAVLVRDYWGTQPQVWVVRISDGAVVSQRTLPANEVADVWASQDGTLVAENSSKSSGYLGSSAPNTIIRRTVDGSVAATLDPTYDVMAFSADDAVALAATLPYVSGSPTHLALVRIADGAVLWRYDGPGEFGGRWIQPNGSAIAVAVQQPNFGATLAVYIVRADGTVTVIDRLP